MNKRTLGILSHVDAGKTTLSEALLYESGAIRKLGRVDRRDAFLDTHALERQRGITIFAKQARFQWEDWQITLLDTPGHVDFSPETERTLPVLDCAILLVSGADGVQGHTETLWKLLARAGVPTFVFVNKMDQPGVEKAALLEGLRGRLSEACVDFTLRGEEFCEALATSNETLLEAYLQTGALEEAEIARLVGQRKVFPVYFGSALRLEGVRELLDGLARYVPQRAWGEAFGAKVFKITRDAQGNRLTHMKITGGALKVRAPISYDGLEEKVAQIRLYSGEKCETVPEAEAGTICAVTGLTQTRPGQGLGCEPDAALPVLEPVLSYRLRLPEGSNLLEALARLRQLEEEEPTLRVAWEEASEEIHVQLMGEVQVEVLASLLRERFGLDARFEDGTILYRETIARAVEGAGHYEPLRHYAEVHLRLEPGARGSGLAFASECHVDQLERNWQRLILTHLAEKRHKGVLTGSEITDMKITLLGGRAHLKHTEGGDFREATYRAVRQGLMKAESVLLEPMYAFELEVPREALGRAMADIEKMAGCYDPPELRGETARLQGRAPVATMRGYPRELVAYTHGRGRLSCASDGFEPCHNAREVIERIGYSPDADTANPSGSVFCAHGAGFFVPWDQADGYMHMQNG